MSASTDNALLRKIAANASSTNLRAESDNALLREIVVGLGGSVGANGTSNQLLREIARLTGSTGNLALTDNALLRKIAANTGSVGNLALSNNALLRKIAANGFGYDYHPIMQAYLDAVAANGGTVSDATAQAYDANRVRPLATAGVIDAVYANSLIKCWCPFLGSGGTAAQNWLAAQTAIIHPNASKLITPTILTSASFTEATGVVGGSNGYFNLNFIPSAQLTFGNAWMSYYCHTDTGGTAYEMGVTNASGIFSFVTVGTSPGTVTIQFNCHSVTALSGQAAASISSRAGLFAGNRKSTTNSSLIRNKVVLDTITDPADGALCTANVFLMARSNNNTPASYSTRRYSEAMIGNSLSDAQADSVYDTLITTYAAIGRPLT